MTFSRGGAIAGLTVLLSQGQGLALSPTLAVIQEDHVEAAQAQAALPPAIAADGLSIEPVGGPHFRVREPMGFRVSVQRDCYVVLVDMDSRGKVTQIFPPPRLVAAQPGDQTIDFLRAGETLVLPDPARGLPTLVAAPPTGVGLVMAIASDIPLQIVDLPSAPESVAGRLEAAHFLETEVRRLTVLSAEPGGAPRAPDWRLATAFYEIR